MTSYAGLDVSQQGTQICILDATGAVRWTGKARSEPTALAAVLRQRAPDLARAVLESGALSGWLCGGLVAAGLPALCIDARTAHGALKQRRSKTDRGDAEGLARLAQTGWFKVVRLKSRVGNPGTPNAFSLCSRRVGPLPAAFARSHPPASLSSTRKPASPGDRPVRMPRDNVAGGTAAGASP